MVEETAKSKHDSAMIALQHNRQPMWIINACDKFHKLKTIQVYESLTANFQPKQIEHRLLRFCVSWFGIWVSTSEEKEKEEQAPKKCKSIVVNSIFTTKLQSTSMHEWIDSPQKLTNSLSDKHA